MTITAHRPTPLPEIEPGTTIRPPLDWPPNGEGDPVQPADLVVDEVRRQVDGWTVYGRPAGKSGRRTTAAYDTAGSANVVATDADLAWLRKVIAGLVDATGAEADSDVKVGDLGLTQLVLEVDGWQVIL